MPGTGDVGMSRWRPRLAIGPLLVFGLLTGLFFLIWRQIPQHQDELLRVQTQVTAEQAAIRLEDYLNTRLELVDQIRREWLMSDHTSRAAFTQRSLALQQQFTGYQAVNWIDSEGVIRWVVPLGSNLPAANRDLHDHPFAAETFIAAESTGELQITPPITLFQGGRGFAAYYPLRRSGMNEGYINAVFRIRSLLDDCLEGNLLGRYAVWVWYGDTEVYHNPVKGGSALERYLATADFRVLGRGWRIRIAPTRSLMPVRIALLNRTLLGLGLVLAAVAGWLFHLYATRQQELALSEAKYRELFESSLDAIYISSTDGQLLDINEAGVRLFGGRSREDMLQVDIREQLFQRGEDRDAFLDTLGQQGSAIDYEVELRRLDGSPITALISATVVTDEQGRFVAIRGIIDDITEQKRLQEQLFRMQKIESLGILAGGIAHDFNNLLGGIMGHASMLRLKTRDSELERYARIIESSVERGKSLTSQLLAFARGSILQRRPVEINQTVQATLRILGRTLDRAIEIVEDLTPDLPTVDADEGQLEQVVMNLCLNARDAMPEGGALTVRTFQAASVSGVETNPGIEGPFVCVTVADSGAGMAPEVREKIFEPFFTTKEGSQGTGLGLSVVYGIVRAHGGLVGVESQPGEGSQFTVYLPVGSTASESRDEAQASPVRGSEVILVVDDDEVIGNIICEALEEHGYRTLGARDGVEALEVFEAHQGEVDLVILDMVMPRLGGRKTFERLLEIDPGVRVMLSTGYSESEESEALLERGVAGFIQKPYSVESLLAAVRSVLDETRE
jgi:PAS domain S-box-containing protein